MGRYRFHVKRNEAKLFAIYKLPNGKLVKKPVKREQSMVKKYDGYVKSVSGIYVPPSLRKHL